MSDKTCGTCQRLETHRAPLYGRFLCYYNVSIASNGVEIPNPRSEDDAACESWIERTDSLEAVALDAYDLVKRAISALAMTTIGVEATDAAVIDLVQDETAICSRLEDLGVKQKWSLS